MDFAQTFALATGHQPLPYQTRLGEDPWPDLLDVPTGLGKTAAVTLAWLYKRGWRQHGRHGEMAPDTPRRLVWCLPMRVLVEQTEDVIERWLRNLGICNEAGQNRVSVHVLMGGESDLKTWAEYPEEDMILIGTQDMLLSRALMRGYGMSRYQWPMHFALLHNDCLWAFDEVQLMGAGLTTSAQLEAFRRTYLPSKASRSLWLSATLNQSWLDTIDLAPHLDSLNRLELGTEDRTKAHQRLNAVKSLQCSRVALTAEADKKAGTAAYLDALCHEVLAAHDETAQTLIIVNRVDRAQGLFRLLRKQRGQGGDLLIHARFRPGDRRAIEERLRKEPPVNRIVVATQAIEAGVDISSRVLFTELAPWASLVQRFGRCNRYGEHNDSGGAQVFWIDIEDDADTLPYEYEPLATARDKLVSLITVGPADLPGTDEARPLTHVLRRKDLLDLFNTDPDLSGFDVDISHYIRDTDNPGPQVFWRDITDPNEPEIQGKPKKEELCSISISQAKTLRKRSAWCWDSLSGCWQPFKSRPRPGMTLMLSANEGGYDTELGFTGENKPAVKPVAIDEVAAQEHYSGDARSTTQRPIALSEHLGHVARQAEHLCEAVGETAFISPITRAGRWHDLGKAHPVFDNSMHRCDAAPEGFLAKSNCPGPMHHERRYFRHELASALAWLAQHDTPSTPDTEVDLIAYLIAAHHGKVRMSLRALPNEPPAPNDARYARGIWEGDCLPALEFDGESSQQTTLRLALMELGEGDQGRSWASRTLNLLDHYGPFRLAWMETLVRISDWRASAAEQEGNIDE